MNALKFDFSCLTVLSNDIMKIGERIISNERSAVMAGGMAYQRDVMRLAPVDTGQYRASIRTDSGNEGLSPVALIGTDKPQACRLEFGFFGPDKLGRVYHQQPRPHWRPPFDQNKQHYRDIMFAVLAAGESK